MKTITKISSQKEQGRYNLFLDGTFFAGISEETLVKLGLKKGMQVDENELEEILKEESRNKCFTYCLKLLARQNYFEKALIDKLKQKEYAEDDITYALERLKAYRYLDDIRLAEAFIKDKKNFAKKGPSYIAQALKMKGISYEAIAEKINEHYSDEEAYENCKYAALKKVESYKRKCSDKYTLKNKMYGYLMQKGFKTHTISKVLEEILQDGDEMF